MSWLGPNKNYSDQYRSTRTPHIDSCALQTLTSQTLRQGPSDLSHHHPISGDSDHFHFCHTIQRYCHWTTFPGDVYYVKYSCHYYAMAKNALLRERQLQRFFSTRLKKDFCNE